MDFRDNWLANFRAIVDREVAEAGSAKAGRMAVAAKVEMGEQTLYQHYHQRSGKTYPSVDLMVMIEKKYGAGRPSGWSAQSAANVSTLADARPRAPDLAEALKVIATRLDSLDESRAEEAGRVMSEFARYPVPRAINAVLKLLGEQLADSEQQAPDGTHGP